MKKKKIKTLLLENKSTFFYLVFSSMMLSLSLVGSLISNIFPFILGSSFLRIDMGMIFIFFTFSICGWRYGVLVLIGNFIIHPILPGTNIGFIELFVLGKTIYIITTIIYISITFATNKILKNKTLITSLLISSVITTVCLILLNGMIFTPIFLNVISNGYYSNNFTTLMKQYTLSDELKLIFIFQNYWVGIILVYGCFNIFTLTLYSIIISKITKYIKF